MKIIRKLFKVLGVILLVLVGIVVIAVGAAYANAENLINRTYSISPQKVNIPADADSIKEGERLASIRGCSSCHAADLGGDPAFVTGFLGNIGAPNLTRGQGGRVGSYTDEDWVRSVRHGVGKNGKALWIMPAHEMFEFSEADLGKIIAFVKQAPPVDRAADAHEVSIPARIMLLAGVLKSSDLLPAEKIAHADGFREAVAVGATVEYGRYMATTCSGCHNPNYSGGPGPGDEPGAPIPANLTQVVKGYDEAQFVEFLRTLKTPGGREVIAQAMPPMGKQMTETELKALYAYFKSLPARETGK